MAALVDTNVLVYRFDTRFPEKQRIARDVLRERAARAAVAVPHQAIVEFVAAVTKPQKGGGAILTEADAWREAEDLLTAFPVLYPTDEVLRTAFRGAAVYRLSWFDAHLWAYAECFGFQEILSEDFQHGRSYGTVRVTNPFLQL